MVLERGRIRRSLQERGEPLKRDSVSSVAWVCPHGTVTWQFVPISPNGGSPAPHFHFHFAQAARGPGAANHSPQADLSLLIGSTWITSGLPTNR